MFSLLHNVLSSTAGSGYTRARTPQGGMTQTALSATTQCTDLDVGGAQLSRHRAFGGIGFCCTEHTPGDPASVLCCPGDGYTTYRDNEFCHEGTVELQPSATPGTQENFLRENVCPACLLDGTCSPGTLQLDNVQTQGPKVRSE